MTSDRVRTAVVLAIIGLPAIFLGGWPYFLLTSLLVGGAAWELAGMFRHMSLPVSRWLLIGNVAGVLLVYLLAPAFSLAAFTFWVLLDTVWYLWQYERGEDQAALALTATLGGAAYLGLLGSHLIALRGLQDGAWWFLLALLPIWAADSGAYWIGKRWGRHKLSPRLSPKKTWEGYWGGVAAGWLTAVLLGWLLLSLGYIQAHLPGLAGMGAGIVLLAPAGDLAESLFKRQAGIKDSGHVFNGHGGFFDRIDSWLWAATLGYWLVIWLF